MRDFCTDSILHKVVVLTSIYTSSIIPQEITNGHSHQDYVRWLLSMEILESHCKIVSLGLDPRNLHFLKCPILYFCFKATNRQILTHLFLMISQVLVHQAILKSTFCHLWIERILYSVKGPGFPFNLSMTWFWQLWKC